MGHKESDTTEQLTLSLHFWETWNIEETYIEENKIARDTTMLIAIVNINFHRIFIILFSKLFHRNISL